MFKKLILSTILLTAIFGIAIYTRAAETNTIQSDLNSVYAQFKNNNEGKVATYIPELAKVDPNLFAIAVVTVDGKLYTAGDADKLFAIESVMKPFVYAFALQENGPRLNKSVGLNATGAPFNSVLALESQPNHVENPLVNAGAIQVQGFIQGNNSDEKWNNQLNFLSKLSNEKLNLGEAYYKSESATNQHNMAIAYLLVAYGLMADDPKEALDRYTKACSVVLTAKQLAWMGGVLANDGVHPATHQRLLQSDVVKDVLSQMSMSGMYENSGVWWTEVGIPSKSGVSGAIIAVVPGNMAIAVFAPRLDASGNSVKGQLVIKELSKRWKLHLLGK